MKNKTKIRAITVNFEANRIFLRTKMIFLMQRENIYKNYLTIVYERDQKKSYGIKKIIDVQIKQFTKKKIECDCVMDMRIQIQMQPNIIKTRNRRKCKFSFGNFHHMNDVLKYSLFTLTRIRIVFNNFIYIKKRIDHFIHFHRKIKKNGGQEIEGNSNHFWHVHMFIISTEIRLYHAFLLCVCLL